MATIDEDLTQLDDYVRRLKVEYDVYFGGGSKKPPAEIEWKVRNLLRKHADGSNMNSGQRFRFNTIQQRYSLFSALWQQKLKIKEEGYRRPQDAILGIQGLRSDEQHAAEAALKHHDRPTGQSLHPGFSIDCTDAEAEPQKVEALFQALSQARNQAGETGGGTLASFRKFVRQKTSQIRQEYGCAAVEYSVEVKDGQVRLKAKPKTS
ncbi:MAG TPA: MXAN_5187 C-terminal domain-containing protein [Candidatus Angelobacter sp.]